MPNQNTIMSISYVRWRCIISLAIGNQVECIIFIKAYARIGVSEVKSNDYIGINVRTFLMQWGIN